MATWILRKHNTDGSVIWSDSDLSVLYQRAKQNGYQVAWQRGGDLIVFNVTKQEVELSIRHLELALGKLADAGV